MKTGDEIFFEIGYDEKEERLSKIVYYVDLPLFRPSISFDKRNKTVSNTPPRAITMEELQAIYKKCQELGWIE